MYTTFWRRATAGMLAAGVFVGLGSGVADASMTGYSSSALPNSYNATPYASPLWSMELDAPTPERTFSAVAVAQDKVFVIKSGVLNAIYVASGKTAWTFGKGLSGAIILDGNVGYVSSSDGKLHQVNLTTGKANWSFQYHENPEPYEIGFSLVTKDDKVFLSVVGGIYALDRNSGKVQWRNPSFEYVAAFHIFDDILLLSTSESGAITVGTTYRIDLNTGEKLWRLGGSHGPVLQVEGNYALFHNDWPNFSDTYAAIVDRVDLRTGETVESLSFIPFKEGQDPLYHQAGRVISDGEQLFIQASDNEIHQYHISAQTGSKPTTVIEYGKDEWIAGPYSGKLFFRDNDSYSIVYARKLIDQTYVHYEGLDNPVSRMDLIGNGMFVGQTDGEIYALNVTTGKALFCVQTEARSFGPFLTSGNVLLAQAEGKLIAMTLPKELILSPGLIKTPVFPKAEASLTIDGQAQKFEPSPVMINNSMFVPLRSLFQAVGAEVDFDTASSQVTVTYGERVFTLKEGAPFAVVRGEQQPMTYAPAMVNGAVYVPLRDVSSLLGVKVNWNDATRTAEITTTDVEEK